MSINMSIKLINPRNSLLPLHEQNSSVIIFNGMEESPKKLFPDISSVGILSKQLSSNKDSFSTIHDVNSVSNNDNISIFSKTNNYGFRSMNKETNSEDASFGSGMRSHFSLQTLPMINLSSIHSIIHHPISAGYLFKFCEEQYCSESIRFIIAVDKYREYVNSVVSSQMKESNSVDTISNETTSSSDNNLFASSTVKKSWKAIDKEMCNNFSGYDLNSINKKEMQNFINEKNYFSLPNNNNNSDDANTATTNIDNNNSNNNSNNSSTSNCNNECNCDESPVLVNGTIGTVAETNIRIETKETLPPFPTTLSPKSNKNSTRRNSLSSCATSGSSRENARLVITNMIKAIWDEFLCDSAPSQIFIPSTVLVKTIHRIKLLHYYHKEIFQEVLIDPIKTIQKDIKPRFLLSSIAKDLKLRAEEISEPAQPEHYFCPPPEDNNDNYKLLLQNNNNNLSLQHIINDKLLFNYFLDYLKKSMQCENLRFIRATQVFREAIVSKDPVIYKGGVDRAWNIFMYFIAPQSCFEVSVSASVRREIMRTLAVPHSEMFAVVEKEAMALLTNSYSSFISTSDYSNMKEAVLQYSKNNKKKNNTSSTSSKDSKLKYLLPPIFGKQQ